MSGPIDRKKEQRFQFLRRLYELTGGDERKKLVLPRLAKN
jgi:hypothetical protein